MTKSHKHKIGSFAIVRVNSEIPVCLLITETFTNEFNHLFYRCSSNEQDDIVVLEEYILFSFNQ
jgi:hypothetical protein